MILCMYENTGNDPENRNLHDEKSDTGCCSQDKHRNVFPYGAKGILPRQDDGVPIVFPKTSSTQNGTDSELSHFS